MLSEIQFLFPDQIKLIWDLINELLGRGGNAVEEEAEAGEVKSVINVHLHHKQLSEDYWVLWTDQKCVNLYNGVSYDISAVPDTSLHQVYLKESQESHSVFTMYTYHAISRFFHINLMKAGIEFTLYKLPTSNIIADKNIVICENI